MRPQGLVRLKNHLPFEELFYELKDIEKVQILAGSNAERT